MAENTPGDTAVFDQEAELFLVRSQKVSGRLARYRRFGRAADAIRFAIEELPSQSLAGAYLEIEEVRFGSREMRRLYDSAAYPFTRRAAA
jgi:hypothetical protein